MRGGDRIQSAMFSYLSPETRVRKEHPLRAIRGMVDSALGEMSPLFDDMYSELGRPSIAPEKLLRAQLHICALDEQDGLWLTIRNADGTWPYAFADVQAETRKVGPNDGIGPIS